MRSKKKFKCRFIGMVVLMFSIIMSAASVQAGSNWMASAKQVRINKSVKGVAKNNCTPTLMDPYYYYEDIYYFNVSAKTNITFTLSVKGVQNYAVMFYNSRGDYLGYGGQWNYSRARNQSTSVSRRTFTPGEYYIRFSNVFRSNSEKYPYTLKLQGKLTATPKINSVRKSSATKARVTWNRVSNVTGYEIFRKTAGGSYKKIATVSGRNTSYRNGGLKRRRNYYYVIRAYKVTNGVKVYSNTSRARGIRM